MSRASQVEDHTSRLQTSCYSRHTIAGVLGSRPAFLATRGPKNGGHFVAMFAGKSRYEAGPLVLLNLRYRYESAHNGFSRNRLGQLLLNSQGGDRGSELVPPRGYVFNIWHQTFC